MLYFIVNAVILTLMDKHSQFCCKTRIHRRGGMSNREFCKSCDVRNKIYSPSNNDQVVHVIRKSLQLYVTLASSGNVLLQVCPR